jgi:hypothetical protein
MTRQPVFCPMRVGPSGAARLVLGRRMERRQSEPFHDLRAVAGFRPSYLTDRRSPRVPPVARRVPSAPTGDLRSQAGRGRRPAPSASRPMNAITATCLCTL